MAATKVVDAAHAVVPPGRTNTSFGDWFLVEWYDVLG